LIFHLKNTTPHRDSDDRDFLAYIAPNKRYLSAKVSQDTA
jgi:hypothetical protein